MSTALDDGGPAFPSMIRYHTGEIHAGPAGMSLRDWFAGKALQGLLANPKITDHVGAYCSKAYELADYMLKARARSEVN